MNSVAFTSKSVFEFVILNPSKLIKPLYTPPFATANNMFWQLRFDPKFIDDNEEYCSVFLGAIPSPQEADNTNAAWAKRSLLSAKLFLKNPLTQTEIDKYLMTMNNYSAKEHTWGRRKFCKKMALSHEQVILGVEFDKAEIGLTRHTSTLPGDPVPKDLLEAWQSQLTEPQFVDVEFNVDGKTIYANSKILAKRSEYFQSMFAGNWSETTNRNKHDSQLSETPSTFHPNPSTGSENEIVDFVVTKDEEESDTFFEKEAQLINNHHRYKINVTDFHNTTFLEMLKFLYTNKVTFNNSPDSHTSSLEMFRVADKYLIEDLRQRAKTRIFDELNTANAAETLFGTDWSYPELKDHILKFVVKHFRDVRQTDGFKNILQNPANYQTFSETLLEIHELLEPSTAIENLQL